jgi:multiple sugar transport system ATP-binding protein
MNLVAGRLTTTGTGMRFDGANLTLDVPPALAARALSRGARDVIAGLRPSALRPLSSPGTHPVTSVQVYAWEPFGKYSLITVQSDGVLLRIKTPLRDRFDANQIVDITADPSNLILFDAQSQGAL